MSFVRLVKYNFTHTEVRGIICEEPWLDIIIRMFVLDTFDSTACAMLLLLLPTQYWALAVCHFSELDTQRDTILGAADSGGLFTV